MTVSTYSAYVSVAVYPATPVTVTGGGSGAQIDLDYTGGFLDPSISVINNPGNGYSTGDILQVDGSVFGNVSGRDDVFLEVTAETGGAIDPGGFVEYVRGQSVADGTYSTIETSTGGLGTGSTFTNDLLGVAGIGYAFGLVNSTVDSFGPGYVLGDWIQISGDQLGGQTPQDDLYLLVNSVINPGETSEYSTIVGGDSNSVADSCNSTVAGGSSNCIASSGYSIVSGRSNCAIASIETSVIGGRNNSITNSSNSSIVGGCSNCILGCKESSISGGRTNCINSSCNSHIGGGCNNCITNACDSHIGGGRCNVVCSSCSTISGGYGNTVSILVNCSSISGGHRNSICSGIHSTIGGGSCNRISSSGATVCQSTISGGGCNEIIGSNSLGNKWNTITGGACNYICCTQASTIGGGHCNTNSGSYSVIGGGLENSICFTSSCNVRCSSISGGRCNCIINTSAVAGVTGSTIGAGECNRICNADHSFVGGGFRNVITSCCSMILGGIGNTVSSVCSGSLGSCNIVCCTNSYVVGTNITTVVSCTLHANGLYLKLTDLPTSDPGIPGVVWRDIGAGNVLKISP
jgi:hypothetical protein